jgi:hypothetical protein
VIEAVNRIVGPNNQRVDKNNLLMQKSAQADLNGFKLKDFDKLTVGRWLVGITAGKDYLGVEGFKAMVREDAGMGHMTQQVSKNLEQSAGYLEGFGALGDKTDNGSAIVEFRGIPKMLAYTEVKEFALNFHRYITKLSSDPAGEVFYTHPTKKKFRRAFISNRGGT